MSAKFFRLKYPVSAKSLLREADAGAGASRSNK